jgi:hypothetical protein
MQRINLTCPVNGHKLGEIFQDTSRTEVHPERIAAGVQQDLWHIDGRLSGLCHRCLRQGIHENYDVRWERVERLLDRMRTHGPSIVTIPLTAQAIEASALPR